MNKLLTALIAAGFCLGVVTDSMAWGLKKKEDVIRCEGSTTVLPIAEAFAEYFKGQTGHNVTVAGGGSGNGAKALLNGTGDVGNMSRFMKGKEFSACVEKGVYPVAHVVAFDGIAIVVNEKNPVEELTKDKLRDIFMGRIKNWKKLGGPDMDIVLCSRDKNSGTFDTFKNLVMKHKGKKHEVDSSANSLGSNGAVHSMVKKTPAAIGFVGLGFTDGVKTLKIDGVAPSKRTVKSGRYPVARPLFMWTNGYPEMGSPLFRFLNIHLTRDGQEIIESQGFVPVTKY